MPRATWIKNTLEMALFRIKTNASDLIAVFSIEIRPERCHSVLVRSHSARSRSSPCGLGRRPVQSRPQRDLWLPDGGLWLGDVVDGGTPRSRPSSPGSALAAVSSV